MKKIVLAEDAHPTNLFDAIRAILFDLNNLNKKGADAEEIRKLKNPLIKQFEYTNLRIKKNLDLIKKYKKCKIFIEGTTKGGVVGPPAMFRSLIKITIKGLLGEDIVERYMKLQDGIEKYIEEIKELDVLDVKAKNDKDKLLEIAEEWDLVLIIVGAVHAIEYKQFLEQKGYVPEYVQIRWDLALDVTKKFKIIEDCIFSLAEKCNVNRSELNILHEGS